MERKSPGQIHSIHTTLYIQTPFEEVIKPQTAPEARHLGVPNTDPPQVFKGFGMSRASRKICKGGNWTHCTTFQDDLPSLKLTVRP